MPLHLLCVLLSLIAYSTNASSPESETEQVPSDTASPPPSDPYPTPFTPGQLKRINHMLELTASTQKVLRLSSNDLQALKRMGLSKADVEEVEELARSVARQMRAQMELRGRFQGVDQEKILLQVKKVNNSRELINSGRNSVHSDEMNQEVMMAELKEAKGLIGLEESAPENSNRMIWTPLNLGDAVEESALELENPIIRTSTKSERLKRSLRLSAGLRFRLGGKKKHGHHLKTLVHDHIERLGYVRDSFKYLANRPDFVRKMVINHFADKVKHKHQSVGRKLNHGNKPVGAEVFSDYSNYGRDNLDHRHHLHYEDQFNDYYDYSNY